MLDGPVKGWGWRMSPCVLFVKINHLDKYIQRQFILNSCNSKLLCGGTGDETRPHHMINLIVFQYGGGGGTKKLVWTGSHT